MPTNGKPVNATEPTYSVRGVCQNCGKPQTITTPRGQQIARRTVCKNCGCITVEKVVFAGGECNE